ncbi:glycosyltransferase family 87 protein [Cupriavidus sp. UYPR2.512]|uniref:glycosyltransferase family 87 protein n=1 Tax=Cupriavidus sp. UYPR2.512 TaxID=1080187 RepID=UPI0003821741|nr:glycosyltransferase family 87 protein [Cupriavidus sp. UYPR2.512]UIF86861.1 DUF2029 domain-containing protein [Cupriavidus necator]
MSLDHSSAVVPRSVISRHWLDLDRLRVYSIAMLLIYGVLMVLWAWETKGFTSDRVVRPGADYSVFWSASYLALQGEAARVYDYASLQPVIMAFGSVRGDEHFFLPWLYPPTFLLFVLPLSLLPFALSYLFFTAGTAVMYMAAIVRILDMRAVPRHVVLLPVVAFSGGLEAAMIGQNSLLTAGIAAWSLIHLRSRPVLAGILVGLLSVKPQLAVVLPLAMLADRAWKAFFIAAATAVVMAASSVGLFGWEAVSAFLENSSLVREQLLDQGRKGWYSSPTVFAMMRLGGAPVAAAYGAQAVCALFAIVALLKVWRSQTSIELRIAAAATATLLVSPYLWYYELTWLGIAIAGITADGMRRGWNKGERELMVAAWLLPFLLGVNRVTELPHAGSVVTMLLMAAILRRTRSGTSSTGAQ